MYKNLNRDYWNEKLQPHYSKLIEFTEIAFARMKTCKEVLNRDFVQVDVNPKTCANAVHDVFEAYAKDYFNRVDGFVAGEFEGVFGILLKEECFIRFNKLNNDFSISNAKTDQRDKFRHQYGFGFFPNDLVYLNFGYRVDPFWEDIKGIHIACWNGRFEWEIDVLNEANSLEQMSLELEEEQFANLQQKRRTTLKQFNKKEQELIEKKTS